MNTSERTTCTPTGCPQLACTWVRHCNVSDDPSVQSVNPYNPSTSESTLTSRYVSFGLTWRIGRTEMESQQTHGKKAGGKKSRR